VFINTYVRRAALAERRYATTARAPVE
jgi:hypothetical protein